MEIESGTISLNQRFLENHFVTEFSLHINSVQVIYTSLSESLRLSYSV